MLIPGLLLPLPLPLGPGKKLTDRKLKLRQVQGHIKCLKFLLGQHSLCQGGIMSRREVRQLSCQDQHHMMWQVLLLLQR
jgi:hypothetical protein